MREIKFRAWNPTTQRMSTSTIGLHNAYCFVPDCRMMQFTGLKDANGVEIYESDIIRNERQDWGVIVFNAPFFEVTVSETQSSLYSREWLSACKVIGNIHENPELLESK